MTYMARNIIPVYAKGFRYTVQIEPYSLEFGQVGKPIFQPVVMSRHRSAKQARLALWRLISGRDNGATEYLKAAGSGVALRMVARESCAPFNALSHDQLKGLEQ